MFSFIFYCLEWLALMVGFLILKFFVFGAYYFCMALIEGAKEDKERALEIVKNPEMQHFKYMPKELQNKIKPC